jgi:histidinol-phosphate aminotransferase
MSFSRREFIRNSTLAASIPAVLGLGLSEAQAAASSDIDFSMGFPQGAVLLNRNENPLGPPPVAIEAAKDAIHRSARYADPISLRAALSDHLQLDEDWILVGTGSGELLKLAPLVFARDGANMVSSTQTYRSTPRFLTRLGGEVKWVDLKKENNYRQDIPGLLKAVDANTRIFYLVTPNNPTGESVSYDTLKSIADALPENVLFLIDEAYIHYEEDNVKSGLDLLQEGYKNVLVTRTFSKAYAMAGLRCGYGMGHPDIMQQIAQFGCGPTSTNMAGFAAASAALQDGSHVLRSRDYAQKSRAYFEQNFEQMGIKTLSGCPTFIMAELGDRVIEINQALRSKKIFVRPGGEWELPNHMRISYGHEAEHQAFFSALRELV